MTIHTAMKNAMKRGASPLAAAPAVNGLLALYVGTLSGQTPGWTLLESKEGAMVQVPFEGSYASKGGRIQSPWIDLDKPAGASAYYRLTFSAQTDAHCYWWVDLQDGEGNPLPDINSAVYAGESEQAYDQMVYVMGAAARICLAFQSAAGVQVKDLAVKRVTEAEAAEWCDPLYAKLPPLDFTPPADAFARLPRTAAALKSGAPWRVVMLGDSIQNDSFNSIFQALVKRDFPKSNLDFTISVRGSTGCWHYQEPAQFQNYVARHKPDLLLVGGISNIRSGKTLAEEVEEIRSVIRQAQALGCEVALLSPPHSVDWRPADPAAPDAPLPAATWTEKTPDPNGELRLIWTPYQDAARECGIAFWNMTVPTADAIAASRKPHGWFNRDFIHNNDRGKQIIGRVLQRYFQTAAASPRRDAVAE